MRSLTEFYRLIILFSALAFAFPAISLSPLSIDTDGDGIEDSQDTDDDGDGVADSQDPWPLDSRYSKDTDSDGLPDAWETARGWSPSTCKRRRQNRTSRHWTWLILRTAHKPSEEYCVVAQARKSDWTSPCWAATSRRWAGSVLRPLISRIFLRLHLGAARRC